jgi:hypothetical protein
MVRGWKSARQEMAIRHAEGIKESNIGHNKQSKKRYEGLKETDI